LTRRTKAILPVHLFGHAADLDAILEIARARNLFVLEDGAQAFGGRYRGRMLGSLGHAAAFSFFPSKNLGAFGDGGLFVTNDDRLAATARLLRTHGTERRYENEMLGYNSRLDEIQAAVLRVKLPYVEGWNREREEAARTYRRLLADIPGVVTPVVEDYAEHVFHQYTVRITGQDRDAVQRSLTEDGINTMVYYPVPVHRLPVHSDHKLALPLTEQAAREVLSLPMGPMISNNAIGRVADALRNACGVQKEAAA
jgi:dTDP-4-amino-4,6-dideoxygalactose transaminase